MGEADVRVDLACGWYDRIEPLKDGRVRAEGLDLRISTFDDPRMLFDRMVRDGAFDAAEMSLGEHITRTCAGDNPFVGLPVFTSRVFRHSFICVNTRSGVERPADLAGKRIGVPLWSMSAAVWCRGMLRDEYGADLSGVTWIEGAMDKPGGHGAAPATKVDGATILKNETDRSLSALLEAGEIDATLGALMPTDFGRAPHVRRLFEDFRAVERDYFARTRVHPIMHLIAMRKTFVDRAPQAVAPLYRALCEAKRVALERMAYTGAPKSMLPFLHAEIEETAALFGEDPWPDGLEANRAALETMTRYMREDGLIARAPAADELFTLV